MKKPKKRNPQDTTLRNIRSLKKRMAALEMKVYDMGLTFDSWIDRLRRFESRIEFLERKNAFKVSNEAIKKARKSKA